MSGVKWIEAEGYLVVILPKKAPKTIQVSSSIYKDVKKAAKAEDGDALLKLLFPEDAVEIKSSGKVKMDSRGSVTIEDKIVDTALGRMIKEFMAEDIDFKPLMKFQKNIEKNESEWVRQQLFRFLERNKVSLTDDGCFICYKGVKEKDGNLVDCHTGSILNNVGCSPSMPREKVDPNPHNTCSTGLHVAAHEYVRGIYSGRVYVAVKVNPKDVCSVPYDYNDQKMRTCHYSVVAMMGDEKELEDIYYPWDKASLKKPAKAKQAKKAKTSSKTKASSQKRVWVDLSKPPASVSIPTVLALTGKIIPISQKSKVRVIKYALEYLKESGFKVEEPSRVEIPLEALAENAKKKVSIRGMSGSEIIKFVSETIGENITISQKSKIRVVGYAIRHFAEHGYEVETD